MFKVDNLAPLMVRAKLGQSEVDDDDNSNSDDDDDDDFVVCAYPVGRICVL